MTTRTELELAYAIWQLAHDLALYERGLYAPRPSAPRDAWQALVAAKEAAGLSKVEAIRQAVREQPALYAAQRTLREAPTAPSASPGRAAWEHEIGVRMRGGLSRFQAVRVLRSERPDLAAALDR